MTLSQGLSCKFEIYGLVIKVYEPFMRSTEYKVIFTKPQKPSS